MMLGGFQVFGSLSTWLPFEKMTLVALGSMFPNTESLELFMLHMQFIRKVKNVELPWRS